MMDLNSLNRLVIRPTVALLTAACLLAQLPVDAHAQVADSAQAALVDSVPADSVPPQIARAREIIAGLDAVVDTIWEEDAAARGMSETELQLLRIRAVRLVERAADLQAEMFDLLAELNASDVRVDSIRRAFESFIGDWLQIYDVAIERNTERIAELQQQRATTEPEGLEDLELRIREAQSQYDMILVGQAENLTAANALGIETVESWDYLDRLLVGRAENLVGRLQIAVGDRDRFRRQVEEADAAEAPESENAALRSQFRASEERIRGIVTSLYVTAGLLDGRGYDTDQYRQFAIRATGELTGDVLDPGVLAGLLRDLRDSIWAWLQDNGPTLLVQALIVIALVVLFRIGFRLSWRAYLAFRSRKHSRLLTDLAERMVRPVATILGLAVGLSVVGVDPTALLAGLGVAGIIVGLALQDSLANLAAGFFILTTRPYDVDDTIQGGGVLGTVKAMGLANTTVLTFDNRRLLVPNRKIWGDVIENRSAERIRRVDASVSIGYGEDLDRAIGILQRLLEENEKILDTPEPSIFVADLADSWMELAVRPWVNTEDWWPMTTELPRLIRLRFAESGIEIPYPRREIVTLHEQGPGAGESSTP
jgi:small conductance mechanosensitive channel